MNNKRIGNVGILAALIVCSALLAAKKPQEATRADDSGGKASQQTTSGSTTTPQSEQTVPSPAPEEITVTATRNPTPVAEIGNSVTVIRAAEIGNTQNISDVLQSVPGFNVVQAGSFGSQTSLFVRGGESNFNLIMIDGMQINSPGGAFNLADLSTSNVERIEIVRGPSSVLYGSEAVSSTINIITKKGGTRPSGSFSIDGGTYNSYSVQGSLEAGSEKARFALGAITSDTDGIYEFNSQYRRSEFSATGLFELTEHSNLAANLRYSFSNQHFPTDGSGAVVDPNDFRKGSLGVYSAVYQNHVSNRYGTRVQYGYSRTSSDIFTVFDGVTDFWDGVFENDEDRHYLDWQNSFQIDSGNLFTGGVTFKREATRFGNLSRRSAGFYFQDQIAVGNRAFITGGIRYDNNNRFSSFTTGSLALSIFVSNQLKLRASIGNGFRAPEFNQIIGFPEFGIQGNANLKPEKNVAVDTGLDFYSVRGKGRFSATLFLNRFQDLIEFTFAPPPGQPNYLNIERARSRGVELEGSVAIMENLRLGVLYTLLDTRVLDSGSIPGGEFAEGQNLLRRPRNSGDIYAAYLNNRYRFRVDFRYKGSRDDLQFLPDFTSSRIKLPGYWKLDLSLLIPFAHLGEEGDLAFSLRSQNLLNRQYTEIAGFRSPGRVVSGGMEIAF